MRHSEGLFRFLGNHQGCRQWEVGFQKSSRRFLKINSRGEVEGTEKGALSKILDVRGDEKKSEHFLKRRDRGGLAWRFKTKPNKKGGNRLRRKRTIKGGSTACLEQTVATRS